MPEPEVTGEIGQRRCPVPRCVNAEQPPENWASCFYEGSPCQTADDEQSGRTGEVRT